MYSRWLADHFRNQCSINLENNRISIFMFKSNYAFCRQSRGVDGADPKQATQEKRLSSAPSLNNSLTDIQPLIKRDKSLRQEGYWRRIPRESKSKDVLKEWKNNIKKVKVERILAKITELGLRKRSCNSLVLQFNPNTKQQDSNPSYTLHSELIASVPLERIALQRIKCSVIRLYCLLCLHFCY